MTIDEIYPLTVISDRYTGTYSGANYLAFNNDYHKIPSNGPDGDDVNCSKFWDRYDKDGIVGKGGTPSEAIDDLISRLERRRALSDEDLSKKIKVGTVLEATDFSEYWRVVSVDLEKKEFLVIKANYKSGKKLQEKVPFNMLFRYYRNNYYYIV